MPYVRQVARKASGNDEQGIDADVVAVPGIARRQHLRRYCHAAKPIRVERPDCRLGRAALLDLDEGQHPAAAGDEIDLAARDPRAAGKDAPSLQPKPPGGERFRFAAAFFGQLAVQLPPPSSSARA
jgi:hypothetical protein